MINPKQRERISKKARKDVETLIKSHIDRFNNLLYMTQISYDTFSFKNKVISKKVDNLTNIIENELYNLCINSSLYNLNENENSNDVISFITRDKDSGSLASNIKKYVSVLNSEIEAYIESSLYFDISIANGLKVLKNNLENAYNTDFIVKAYKEVDKPKNNIIKLKGLTVKKGEYKTSLANLKRLAWFVVIESITYRQISIFKNMGFSKVVVLRGSSYPCSYCDSFLGVYDINDFENLPPQHSNCYCYIEPV